jgi:adenylate cyclase
MDAPLSFEVYDEGRLVVDGELAGPIEIGRQTRREDEPFAAYEPEAGGPRRLVIGRLDETALSRRHARLEPLPGGRVRLSNLSERQPIVLEGGERLEPGAVVERAAPLRLRLGPRVLSVAATSAAEETLGALDQQTVIPGSPSARLALSELPLPFDGRVESESVVRWLQHALDVLQSAATSRDFLEQAARAVVEVAGLDSGIALLRRDEQWEVGAYHARTGGPPSHDWSPSRRVLARVCEQRRTLWTQIEGSSAGSLGRVSAVIAAPILDRHGELIGALYGDRRGEHDAGDIRKVEAMVVELLASSVAAGLARQREERVALEARVRFEQFFTPALSRRLQEEPELLAGRDAEVTVLVADLVGFSSVSERLGPTRTIDWLRDTMTLLSNCALDRDGVVVDYVGDEMMAMWGTPGVQPDHPVRACSAALDMLAKLPALAERWRPVLGEAMRLGIGISTGPAWVGNVGSERKFKYGPLGTTVNLASRIQGATKYLRTPLLVSGTTRARLGPEFESRRLCTVRLVNLSEPVELFEVERSGEAVFGSVRQLYEEALLEFERGRFDEATRILGEVLAKDPDDGPTLALMRRTLGGLLGERRPFDPVWELPGK